MKKQKVRSPPARAADVCEDDHSPLGCLRGPDFIFVALILSFVSTLSLLSCDLPFWLFDFAFLILTLNF